jgi:hypothetical protein
MANPKKESSNIAESKINYLIPLRLEKGWGWAANEDIMLIDINIDITAILETNPILDYFKFKHLMQSLN